MPYREAFTQQHGFMHAGIIATALDSACGYAAFSLMPADAEVLTVEFKTNLLAPAKGELLSVSRPGGQARADVDGVRSSGVGAAGRGRGAAGRDDDRHAHGGVRTADVAQ